ncbi:MAG: hypothetical protein WD076_02060 [Parvularculaceae bacterium]
MALYVANAIKESGPRFDVRAVESAPSAKRTGPAALLFAPLGFIRNIAQGACAGLLTLLGAMHFIEGRSFSETTTAPLLAVETGSLQSIAQNLLAGGGPGVVEIIGAVVLFLSAGHGAGRMIGLLGFLALAIAHANGASQAEFTAYLTSLYAQIKGMIPSLMVAG